MRRPLVHSAACWAVLTSFVVFAGCYEDEAEVTIHADGTGAFRQRIEVSEQLAYMFDHEPEGGTTPGPVSVPFSLTREATEAMLGEGGVIKTFDVVDNPDRSRVIEVAGTFESAAAFFASHYSIRSLNLRLWKVGDEIRIGCDASFGGGATTLTIDHLYGMAKGMRVTRTIRAPAAIRAEHGRAGDDTVRWSIDLTDRAALAATKRRLDESIDGVWVAAFDADAVDLRDADLLVVDPEEGTAAGVGVLVVEPGAGIGAAAGAAAALLAGKREADEILAGAAIGAALGGGVGVYMDLQVEKLARIPSTTVERVGEDALLVKFQSDILFDGDSAVVDGGGRATLDELAAVLVEYPKTAVVVQDHTDSTGSEDHNLALSDRRASAVANHLIARGVAGGRVTALGMGEGYPVADNDSESGRQLNRRVDILLQAKAR
jgi:outer membrane protein OmpA-like peptidoglycan-associated protein